MGVEQGNTRGQVRRISEIRRLRNLGARSEGWLNAVGIYTRDDLSEIGSVLAFKMIQQHGFAPTLNLLYALEGALRNVNWTKLPTDVKNDLRAAVAE